MGEKKRVVNLGIGFVTGRKNFRSMARTYAHNWNEYGLVKDTAVRLHLLVAYDLKYSSTKPSDYRKIDDSVHDLTDSVEFIGNAAIRDEARRLVAEGVVTRREAALLFGEGYAKRRNVVLYYALKNGLDYLMFLDDDEYPLAPLHFGYGHLSWMGQNVIGTHLRHIPHAEVTHGHHCGYISPIPQLEFSAELTEDDFRTFIEAVSNDILNWESVKRKMEEGGVTYADRRVLEELPVHEVEEVNHAKFISGSNLCFNLRRFTDLPPFYNPPGARGEDTFLSTCLSQARVLRVPCYTFHDGFLAYAHLLHGVLPRRLAPIRASSPKVVARFLRAAVGWVRYKPLLVRLTRRQEYEAEIRRTRRDLERVVPKLARRLGAPGFLTLPEELERYHRNVERHRAAFAETREAWKKVVAAVARPTDEMIKYGS